MAVAALGQIGFTVMPNRATFSAGLGKSDARGFWRRHLMHHCFDLQLVDLKDDGERN